MLIVASLFAALVCSLAFPLQSSTDEKQAEEYLSQFYKNKSNARYTNFGETIKQMQRFFGLTVTGNLSQETMDIMKKPRCGVPDMGDFTTFRGKPKWNNKTLTYRILNFTPDLPEKTVIREIGRAFDVWSKVTPLRFLRITRSTADIMIRFAVRYHGDSSEFDGKEAVLAHAFAPGPGIGGDVHFDEDETWTATHRGTNLFTVAAHEFGHALGLDHSDKTAALMYPTYKYSSFSNFQLSQDDTRGIQSLYGTKK